VLLSRIKKRGKFSLIFEELLKCDPYFIKCFFLQRTLFYSTLEWEDSFEYQILPDEHDFIDYSNIEEIRALIQGGYRESKSIKNRMKAIVPTKLLNILRKSVIKNRIKRKKIDLAKLLVCPACKQDLIFGKQEITCSNCQHIYAWKNNIPYLVIEDKKREK
jgi:uncharacterized protein YbaR (Trm112 family)